MLETGIHPGDILVVDRSIAAAHRDIVIAGIHGELTVKELELKPNTRLVPRNASHQSINIPDGCNLDIFGVVTSVIRDMRRKSSIIT